MVYVVWALVVALLFWRLSAPVAAMVSLIAGWLVLPVASFPPELQQQLEFNDWVLGGAIPSPLFLTKSSVSGLACLLGIALFDHKAILRRRPTGWDLLLLLCCLVPLLSALANSLPLFWGIKQGLYLFLSWGVPYLVGRLYLSSEGALHQFSKAVVTAGLISLPFCLVEFFMGPVFYQLLYGFHPYVYDGHERYLLFRPMLLTEHGNQLGIWIASSALLAYSLYRRGERQFKLPLITLVGATILTQSVGAILLLGVGALFLVNRRLVAIAMTIVLLLLGVRVAGLLPLEKIRYETAVGAYVADLFKATGRQSFTWRLKREEVHLDKARERLIFGWGKAHWWDPQLGPRPWSLWVMFFGQYGLAGLLSLTALLIGPSIAAGKRRELGLVSLLLINAFDALLNTNLILFFLAVSGAMVNRTQVEKK